MGSFYMESTQINYRRDETLKTVDQKLQELSETSAIDTDIAPVFKSTNTYAPGDLVYYRNKLYRFNVEHTGAWAAADVTATDVTTEISSLKSGLTNLNSNLSSLDAAVNAPDNAGKNLLPFTLASLKALNTTGTWVDNVYTKNGVEFTVNTNASVQVVSIVADGTATGGNADFDLTSNASIPDASKGLLYSGCPSGSATTYGLCRSGAGIIQFGGNDVAWPTSVTAVTTFIRVIDEATCENVTFTPMLRDARISDATFAPYVPSVNSRLDNLANPLGTYNVMGIFQTSQLYNNSYGIAVVTGFDPSIHTATINSASTLDGTELTLTYNPHSTKKGVIGFFVADATVLGKIVNIDITVS